MAGADRLKAEGRVREQVLSMEDRNGPFDGEEIIWTF
jgi:hypothetical protein